MWSLTRSEAPADICNSTSAGGKNFAAITQPHSAAEFSRLFLRFSEVKSAVSFVRH